MPLEKQPKRREEMATGGEDGGMVFLCPVVAVVVVYGMAFVPFPNSAPSFQGGRFANLLETV